MKTHTAAKKYFILINKHPLLSRCLMSFGMNFTGDVVCQWIESKYSKESIFKTFNLRRAFVTGVFTFGCLTPSLYYWLRYLDKTFPGTTFKQTAKKFVLDRFFFPAPILFVSFVSQTLMIGGTLEDAKTRIEKNYIQALKTNFLVWPAAIIFNFKFVPLYHQVMFINVVGFFWAIFMSYSINRHKITEFK